MTPAAFLWLLGALLVLSYAADVLFLRTRVPAAVLLIAFGVLLGPVLKILPGAEFLRAAPYFGGLALVTILFEGGMGLDLDESIKGLASGTLLAVFSFLLTAGTIGFLAHGILGLPGPSALALGSLLGVPSSAVVLPVLGTLGLRDELRTRLVLDAATADVLGILGVEIAIGALSGQSVPSLVLRSTVVGFAVGAAVAVGVGLVWSRYLRWASGTGALRLGEALTFGVALLLDGSVSALGGASAVAVVAFGIVLANEPVLMQRAFRRELPEQDVKSFEEMRGAIHRFMRQTTFVVLTFFFVFLGVVVDWNGITLRTGSAALAFGAICVLGRRAALVAVNRAGLLPLSQAETNDVAALFPRGLVTAVLAFEAMGAQLPGAESFPLFAFVVLVVTNLAMVFSFQATRRGQARALSAGRIA
jgi:NhaP-type Na+/H+ or K+/H+ antiporter